jgi:hypothetical protein
MDTAFLQVYFCVIKSIVDDKVVYGSEEYKSVTPLKLPVIPEWSPVKYYGGYQYK